MKHEHSVEVTIPASIQEKVDRASAHLKVNKKAYLFGLGGIVVGVAGTRIFSRPNLTVCVNVEAATSATTGY